MKKYKTIYGLVLSLIIPVPALADSPVEVSPRITPPIVAQRQPQEKVRIAVLDFDAAAMDNLTWLSYMDHNTRGVRNIFINRLAETGKYTVIEASRVDNLLPWKDWGGKRQIDAQTAAEIGRKLGVEVVIVGSLTRFDISRRGGNIGLGWFGVNIGGNSTEAVVEFNVRAINTNTGEVIMVAKGNGSSTQVDPRVYVWGRGGGTYSSSQEGQLLASAAVKAVDQVIEEMNRQYSKFSAITPVVPSTTAIVADVTGNTVVLNKGKKEGYRVGMRLAIERVEREVKDPQSGQVIRRITVPLGEIELYDVDEASSLGRIVSGRGFKVGDIAKPRTGL
ncbi:MAG: CsgG/HfaB family protein [Geminocystis sp.]|nr:CsgG/HfaB family protein [Geminocystis sp.]HIK38441.1 penicillin-binding protein activator LpoB [Geminocystis sp. M7585_C2015_104]MCS7147786.1 CsgG/HfaB family protein [Geminocystis sp.]MCX8079194.1 CsgG/HfaB family protein [Geminocystis sp.]MDW8116640.1 CsgG/HfaB family protein [Geminocystis sp.]